MNKKISLENAFNELSNIVKEIEKDDISIEDAIELFEKGVSLTELCREKLKNAEVKVNSLNKKYDLCIYATPHRYFAKSNYRILHASLKKDSLIYDVKNILPNKLSNKFIK